MRDYKFIGTARELASVYLFDRYRFKTYNNVDYILIDKLDDIEVIINTESGYMRNMGMFGEVIAEALLKLGLVVRTQNDN